jgi:hypothetical protein
MSLAWRRGRLRVEYSSPARPRFQQEAGSMPPILSALPLSLGTIPNGEKAASHDVVNPQEIREGPMAGAGTRISGEAET